MNMPNTVLSEADTKAKLIDPELHKRGWTEDRKADEEIETGRPDQKTVIFCTRDTHADAVAPKRKRERAFAFEYKNKEWFENTYIFQTPEVVKAGGLHALKSSGKPQEIITETKRRILAA